MFKLVPMLNPDGVIVGNYRCSLAGRDLNRNYRHPRRDNFPTIYALKAMVEEVAQKHEVCGERRGREGEKGRGEGVREGEKGRGDGGREGGEGEKGR